MKVTRYFDLTEEQKLALSDIELDKAVKLEAAHRGLQIPIPVDQLLNNTPEVAFHTPEDSITIYELCSKNSWGSAERTGIGFRTEAAAFKALEGALRVKEDTYPKVKRSIADPDFTVQAVRIATFPEQTWQTKLDQLKDDYEPFNKLAGEIFDDLSSVRQAAYDRRVRDAKRRQFMELAGGDEDIARKFWANIEKTEWPEPLSVVGE